MNACLAKEVVRYIILRFLFCKKKSENCVNQFEETSIKTFRKSSRPAFYLNKITEVLWDNKKLIGREKSDLDVWSALNKKLSTKTTA